VPRPRIVLLLPPSEGKATQGTGPPWDPTGGAFGRLAKPRRAVARALAKAARDRSVDHAALFGVKDVAPARAAAKALLSAPTAAALDRYTGVLFDALGVRALSAGQRATAEQGTVMISGLAGLVTGGDGLPDYKLPIGTVLPGIGGLAAFWRPHVTRVLDAHVEDAVVWDLLPGAHAACWTPGGTWRERWVVKVVREDAQGRRTTVSHDNKSTKGALARAVLTGGVTDPSGLARWADGEGLVVEQEGSVIVVVRR
jgi:cytoplasmic iron level regulating protein YaaA (DUF328/UPF0246 family)